MGATTNSAWIYKGDDTSAFGQNFIEITLSGIQPQVIAKVIFQCGTVQKVYENPEFPLYIDFTSAESSQLYEDAVCYLQVFDVQMRRHTCSSTLKFKAY